MDKVEAIFDYKMTRTEALAYKIGLIWEIQSKKFFPNHKNLGKYPKRGDPRKSTLFKYSWKLLRETRGLLKEEDYSMYVKANLTVLKLNNAWIGPSAICGDKGWIRWKMWKRWYDKKLAEINERTPPPQADPRFMRELDRTKKFLLEKCEGKPTEEKLKVFKEKGLLKLWVLSAKVSLFYIVLSPMMDKICDIEQFLKECNFDKKLMEEKVTDELYRYYKQEFKNL